MEVINFCIEFSDKNSIKHTFSMCDTIRNVLLKTCNMFGISEEDYELRYGNRILQKDMELSQSDLPPEAHLNLCPCQCSNKQSVQVDLLLGNIVKSGQFKCSDSLWDVSQVLIPKDRFIEEERVQISCFGKTVVGKTNLQMIPLASLNQKVGKITMKLSRKFSKTNISKDTLEKNKNQLKESSSEKKSTPNMTKIPFTRPSETRKAGSSVSTGSKNNSLTSAYPISCSLKALTSVDNSFYKNSNEKLKGVIHVDRRKGLIYNIKDLPRLKKTGSELLGLNNETTNRTGGKDGDIHMKIVFPDRWVLQADFGSEETVKDVYNFIAQVLKCSTNSFILYTKDPKCDISKDKTLSETEGTPEDTLFLRLCPGVTRNSIMSVLREIVVPSSTPKVNNSEKRWSISRKINKIH